MGLLRRLFIPRKGTAEVDALDTNWRAIEQWAQNVGGIQEIVAGTNVSVADGFGPVVTVSATGGGGGSYASLTGPGKTTTPGDLTQAGGFTVNDTVGDGINLTSTGQVELDSSFASGTGIGLTETGSSGIIRIVASGAGGAVVVGTTGGGGDRLNLSGSSVYVQTSAGALLSFFNASPVVKPTVTGSRGGNAALASLLTALSALGLLNDSSTP